jgi:hypothetical protein
MVKDRRFLNPVRILSYVSFGRHSVTISKVSMAAEAISEDAIVSNREAGPLNVGLCQYLLLKYPLTMTLE